MQMKSTRQQKIVLRLVLKVVREQKRKVCLVELQYELDVEFRVSKIDPAIGRLRLR